MRLGIMTEFPSPAVQSGPAIHTRFLYQGMSKRGHDVVLMGPDTGSEVAIDHDRVQLCRGYAYPTHPKVKIPMPGPMGDMLSPPKVDLIHSQTNTHMVHYAVWQRRMWQVPVLNTHTVHLPTHSHFLLSDSLYENVPLRRLIRRQADQMELNFARLYNQGDCLIVQSRHFVDYWRQRGVTIPIEVVGRPIDPAKFSRMAGEDPYPRHFVTGKRMVVVCRHDREKSLDQLIRIFDREIAPADPEVTLTLVGDGHDHANLLALADKSAHRNRIHFPGEVRHDMLVDWYSHADLFVYTSVSETFGNVVNEALWCGLPAVALNDRMGVAHQVADGVNGFLVNPGQAGTDREFASGCLLLTRDHNLRRKMSEQAANLSRRNAHPDVVLGRFESIYGAAHEHCRSTVIKPLSERSRVSQLRAFAHHVSRWSWYNGWLLAIAHTATRLGATRGGASIEHVATSPREEASTPTTSRRAAV